MCNITNNASLSHFLEGVNFLEGENIMEEEECEFSVEDVCGGSMLMLDMDMTMEDMDLEDALNVETLPPLGFEGEEDTYMDTLLTPPEDNEDTESTSTNTSSTSTSTSTSTQSQLEKLAHCMRRSEETKFKLAACSSPALAKANPFFTGSRVTITPELEKSRQQLWSFVRMQQETFMTQNTHFTAAA